MSMSAWVTGDWLTADHTQAVFDALQTDGHRAFAVGGCVRNALFGVAVTDVDIATDATPDEVQSLAHAAGLKSVPTGIDHGTITVVSGGVGYEVTTFRADVQTDGRHAVVRFSTDAAQDAARRDFTINALYADAAGLVYDPLGGLTDLRARRIRFIGAAKDRIVEDYLRILRYFRFSAWYGDPDLGFDPDALAAIADTLEGLGQLSRERIGAEMLKLLSAPDPAPAVAAMVQTGALQRIVPGAIADALAPLVHFETELGLVPDPIRRLACLGPVEPVGLRLSKKQTQQLEQYQTLTAVAGAPAELGYRYGADVARDVYLLRSALFEMPLNPDALSKADMGARQVCPVTARDLMPDYSGAALGARLRQIETRWIASDFSLSKSELLE